MSEEAKKLGTKESEEVLDFLIESTDDLVTHKEDDGKISTVEWLQTVAANVPAGVAAVKGIDDVFKECQDLDEQEAKVLAGKGMILAQNVMRLFGLGEE